MTRKICRTCITNLSKCVELTHLTHRPFHLRNLIAGSNRGRFGFCATPGRNGRSIGRAGARPHWSGLRHCVDHHAGGAGLIECSAMGAEFRRAEKPRGRNHRPGVNRSWSTAISSTKRVAPILRAREDISCKTVSDRGSADSSDRIELAKVECMSEFVTVTTVGSIPPGQGATFQVGERLIAVFFDGGQYYAIDDMCPHMGASLGAGEVQNGAVTCPWHAWRFRISDGTWCDNPRIKISSFEVRVVGDQVQVCVP